MALDFTTASLDSRVTVTRALNTATAVNSSGYVASVNANLPRFDYDPVTLACKGLLIEETRVNLLTYTEAFNGASWAPTNATVTADAVASPANTTTADKLIATAVSGIHRVFNTDAGNAVNGTTYTLSVYAKAGEYAFLRLVATLYMTNGPVFDLSNGTIASTGGFTATITPAANGFYRCTATFTASGTNLLVAQILAFPTSSTADYVGNGTSGLNLWGAQLEAGAFATSYIPTTTTSLTRNADVVSMTGTNFSSWYVSGPGTIIISTLLSALSTAAVQSSVNLGVDGNNQIYLYANNTGGSRDAVITASGSGQGFNSISGANTTLYTKQGFAFATNSSAHVVNGGTPVTDATVTLPSAANALKIGSNTSNFNLLNGYVAKIMYWPQRLTNAELQAFTK
jgi:hypothetical protein